MPTQVPSKIVPEKIYVGDCVGCVTDNSQNLWTWTIKGSSKLFPLGISSGNVCLGSGVNVYTSKVKTSVRREGRTYSLKMATPYTPTTSMNSPRLLSSRKNRCVDNRKSERYFDGAKASDDDNGIVLKKIESDFEEKLR